MLTVCVPERSAGEQKVTYRRHKGAFRHRGLPPARQQQCRRAPAEPHVRYRLRGMSLSLRFVLMAEAASEATRRLTRDDNEGKQRGRETRFHFCRCKPPCTYLFFHAILLCLINIHIFRCIFQS